MKLTRNEISDVIFTFVENAYICNEFGDNVGVLTWLFMIEFYKDLLET